MKKEANERNNRNQWIHRNSNLKNWEKPTTAAETSNESKRLGEIHGSTDAESACLVHLSLKTSDEMK